MYINIFLFFFIHFETEIFWVGMLRFLWIFCLKIVWINYKGIKRKIKKHFFPRILKTNGKMNESSSAQVEYKSETELLAEFKRYMCDPTNVERATNYLYNSLVDETIMGVVFELHYLHKTGLDVALEGEPEDSSLYANIPYDFLLLFAFYIPRQICHKFFLIWFGNIWFCFMQIQHCGYARHGCVWFNKYEENYRLCLSKLWSACCIVSFRTTFGEMHG